MIRFSLVISSLVLWGIPLSVSGTGTGLEEPASRPNVLFIICDDLNSHVSTSGYGRTRTPSFDRLAASGVTFNRAYCQYPVCGPSRASLLHGLYPQSTGVLDNKSDIAQTRPGTPSLPQVFRNAGYWTGAVGKVFHNTRVDPGPRVWNAAHRFDNDEMPLVTRERLKFEALHGSIQSGNARRLWKEYYPKIATQTRNQHVGYGASGLTDSQHKDGKNAAMVVQWLKENPNHNKPFFIALGIQKPHVPFLAPDKYFDLYPQEELKFDLTPPGFWDQAPKSAMNSRYKVFGFELGVEKVSLRRDYMQAYHACISFIDAQIGRVLDALEESGHSDNTIVVLTSDHGYQLGEHFMWGKVTLFEECARVPLIIRAPGMKNRGVRSEAISELVDLFPTLTDLCGIQPPGDLDGVSLRPHMENPGLPGKACAFTVVSRGPNLGKAIRTTSWRYALWPDGEELYHLESDPGELNNLANDTGSQDMLITMRRHLKNAERLASDSRKTKSPTQSPAR